MAEYNVGLSVINTEDYVDLRIRTRDLEREYADLKTKYFKLRDAIETGIYNDRKGQLERGYSVLSPSASFSVEKYCEVINVSCEHYMEQLDKDLGNTSDAT